MALFGIGDPEEQQMLDYMRRGMQGYENLELPNYENAVADPRGQAAQMEALNQMRIAANTQGLTPQEQFQLAQGAEQENQRERGARQSILQNMAQRGGLTGGASLAAQLSNQQGSAGRANMQSLGALAQAQQRQQAATGALGGMGSNLVNQGLNINELNNRNRSMGFQNALQRQQGLSGQYNQMAGYYGNQANQYRQNASDLANGVLGFGLGFIPHPKYGGQ